MECVFMVLSTHIEGKNNEGSGKDDNYTSMFKFTA